MKIFPLSVAIIGAVLSVSCASRYSPLALRIRETPAWAIAARRRVLAAGAFYLRSASFCAWIRETSSVGLCGALAGDAAMGVSSLFNVILRIRALLATS